MSSKRRSNAFKWVKCDKCECLISTEDNENHLEECPPPKENWNYRFIRNGVLHSLLEIYNAKDIPENISETEANKMIFLSTSAMEFCNIALGDDVLIIGKNVVVKTAFHSNNSNVVSVSLTKSALELDKLGTHVKVQKLKNTPRLAKEIVIEYLGKQTLPPFSSEFDLMIKSHTDNGIFAIDNKICIPFYCRKLTFRIVKVKFDTDLHRDEEEGEEKEAKDLTKNFAALNISEDNLHLYKAVYNTKWIVLETKVHADKKRKKFKLENIGGYGNLISKIKNLMDDALGLCGEISQFNAIKGILLYGPLGIGKSTIANTLISEYNVYSITISVLNLIPKSHEDTETVLKEFFDEAIVKAPSIILLEDVDTICPKKSNSSTDQERKLLATLINLFDELRYTNAKVAVLATTSKLDFIDNSLRRSGRLQKEFEINVPDRIMRKDILTKILINVPNDLTESEVENISSETHGFVAADLEGLCSEARSCAKERLANQKFIDDIQITFEDLEYALRNVNPSAMMEALVEVPNVKWSEIGGQNELKLKLKQAVEWPLKHPEVFKRMGIVPPKGVLMFGPPGCSKTMIAKALATESNLNFLNINGPELFSKWVGDSEKAVRDIFRKARQVAPSIIFIDEIDALGGERASSSKSGGSNVQERVLTQLLTELDGVTALGNVTLVAATNRPDRLDKALLRPGRLDRIIYVPLPDAETRKEIFSIKLKKMPIAEDIIIQDLVDITEFYSGAEIQAVCHEAAMNALELDLSATIITKEHFRTALSVVKPRTSVSLIKMYDNYLANVDLQTVRTQL